MAIMSIRMASLKFVGPEKLASSWNTALLKIYGPP